MPEGRRKWNKVKHTSRTNTFRYLFIPFASGLDWSVRCFSSPPPPPRAGDRSIFVFFVRLRWNSLSPNSSINCHNGQRRGSMAKRLFGISRRRGTTRSSWQTRRYAVSLIFLFSSDVAPEKIIVQCRCQKYDGNNVVETFERSRIT